MNDFATYKEAFEFAARYRSELKEAQSKQNLAYDLFKAVETFIGRHLEDIEKLTLVEPIGEAYRTPCEWNMAHLMWHLKHEPTDNDVIN